MNYNGKDFNRELDRIIFDYNLDAFYPRYRKMRWAENYLKVWKKKSLESVGVNGRILCIALTKDDVERFRFYTSQTKNFEYYVYTAKDDQSLLKSIEDYEIIYIISYDEERVIAEWLTINGVSYKNIYDDFAIDGMKFDGTFYVFLEPRKEINNELGEGGWWGKWLYSDNNFFFEKYFLEQVQKYMEYTEFLKRMIFLALVFKDFILWEKYQTEILDCLGKEEVERYKLAGREIKNLLEEMKNVLEQRDKRDIMMIWLDALRYGMEKDMPFLSEEMQEGVFFKNAFTVDPWTIPVFRVCFTDQKDIGVGLHSHTYIRKEESSLCRIMEMKGYSFKVITGYFKGEIDGEWHYGECLDRWTPVSKILWNALCCLSESDSPVFMVIHEIAHTHDPFFASEMNLGDKLSGLSKKLTKNREHCAHRDVDMQLKFYMSFMREDISKIYMSDHGVGEPWECMHTLFSIKSPLVKKGTVKEMFSYSNFDKAAVQLMEGRWDPAEFTTDYVCVGTLPLYNAGFVKGKIEDKVIELTDLGYVGVVNEHYFYLKYTNGRELLLDRGRLPYRTYIIPHRDDICEGVDLRYFRNLLRGIEIDVNDNKFQYSQYLFKVANRLVQYPERQIDYINRWIADSGKKRIAIRMGGDHSRVLYEWLTVDNQEKIVCFIDRDKDCLCGNLGKRIISESEIEETDIDGIILSSFHYLKELRQEAKKYPSKIYIFDIYDYLAKQGFPARELLFDLVGMPDSEYEVGIMLE